MAATAPPPLQPNDGVIREARRRQYLRRAQNAVGSVIIVAGLGIGALALAGGGRSGHRAAGRDPRPATREALNARRFAVRLSPSLNGGTYGWCVGIEEADARVGGGGCSATPEAARPLAMIITTGSARTRKSSVFVLTLPQVAALLVNGRERVPTRSVEGLPYGLRAARIVTALRVGRARHRSPTFALAPEPKLVALDARGRAFPSTAGHTPGAAVTLSAHGPCALIAGGLPGLTREWSHVASAIAPYPGAIVGRSFFSCIDTEYYLRQWPLDAAILLDATHPGTPPAPIPGLEPVKGRPGYVNGPGDFKGELTAVRRGNAWLVIAGGESLEQRIEVLRHLTASVRR